eukprot:Opistho-1_new@99093
MSEAGAVGESQAPVAHVTAFLGGCDKLNGQVALFAGLCWRNRNFSHAAHRVAARRDEARSPWPCLLPVVLHTPDFNEALARRDDSPVRTRDVPNKAREIRLDVHPTLARAVAPRALLGRTRNRRWLSAGVPHRGEGGLLQLPCVRRIARDGDNRRERSQEGTLSTRNHPLELHKHVRLVVSGERLAPLAQVKVVAHCTAISHASNPRGTSLALHAVFHGGNKRRRVGFLPVGYLDREHIHVRGDCARLDRLIEIVIGFDRDEIPLRVAVPDPDFGESEGATYLCRQLSPSHVQVHDEAAAHVAAHRLHNQHLPLASSQHARKEMRFVTGTKSSSNGIHL